MNAFAIPFPEALGQVAAFGGTTGAGFFAAKWLVELVTRRLDRREERIDASTTALLNAWIARATSLSSRVDELERRLADRDQQHLACQEEVMSLRAELRSKGLIAQEAQKAIAADRMAERRDT